MYRVCVYRTNEKREMLCFCTSKRFVNLKDAEKFFNKQNLKPKRIAEMKEVV